jgi:hypothetical protein
VSVAGSSPGSFREPGLPSWQPASVMAVGCVHRHDGSPGRLDERARRLSHEEFFVASLLASEGHHVRSLAERPGRSRMADLLVCDTPVEVKSWLGREERGGHRPGPGSVVNKLFQAEGQAPAVVLNGRGSGLTAAAARAGMARYAGYRHPDAVTGVRVVGDGFDLGWAQTRSPQRDVTPRPDRAPGANATERRGRFRPPEPGVNL